MPFFSSFVALNPSTYLYNEQGTKKQDPPPSQNYFFYLPSKPTQPFFFFRPIPTTTTTLFFFELSTHPVFSWHTPPIFSFLYITFLSSPSQIKNMTNETEKKKKEEHPWFVVCVCSKRCVHPKIAKHPKKSTTCFEPSIMHPPPT